MAQVWIVIKDATVVAWHPAEENLFNIYDNTHDWYLSDNPPETTEEIERTYVTEALVAPEFEENNEPDQVVQENTNLIVLRELAVIPDPRLVMTLSNAKAAVKTMIAARIEHEILATYPLQLQQTIAQLGIKPGGGNYNSTDVTNMNTFINGKLTAKNTKNGEVDALADVAACIAYDVYA